MLVFRAGSSPDLFFQHEALWKIHKQDFSSFQCLDSQWRKIAKGGFSYLRRNFILQTVALFDGEQPLLMATYFQASKQAKAVGLSSSVGLIATHPNLKEKDAQYFWKELRKANPGEKIIAPLNAHAYLGFSAPDGRLENQKYWTTGFLTSSHHPRNSILFSGLEPYRKYFSYETHLNDSILGKLEADLSQLPAGITIRGFSRLHCRRDLRQMNELVNECFTEHFNFQPLTVKENFEIFFPSLPLLASDLFLFLEVEGKLAGFCFGMLDYNRSLRAGASDAENLLRLIFARPKRGRLIHIGIRPKYRGQGLIKAIRHQILLNFVSRGVTEIENSYMDEGNINSLANVASTGGAPLGTFSLFQVP